MPPQRRRSATVPCGQYGFAFAGFPLGVTFGWKVCVILGSDRIISALSSGIDFGRSSRFPIKRLPPKSQCVARQVGVKLKVFIHSNTENKALMKTCRHLQPLETELARNNIPLGDPAASPYGTQWGLWSPCDCVFDEPALRSRLALPACVTYEEYDGRVAGSDATFYCKECKRAIMGCHPRYAGPTTRRLD